jgi:hypothetical protein
MENASDSRGHRRSTTVTTTTAAAGRTQRSVRVDQRMPAGRHSESRSPRAPPHPTTSGTRGSRARRWSARLEHTTNDDRSERTITNRHR